MIVNGDGSISSQKWEINGKEFQIIASESAGRFESVWTTKDTIKYPDGQTETMTRKQLKHKFNHL